MTIGILAYGSLRKQAGAELDRAIARRIGGIKTPFPIEFARSSRRRDGAPTLVHVKAGGALVEACVLVLKDSIGEERARDMLYRRETDQVDEPVSNPWVGWIKARPGFSGLDTCLYTALEPCIDPLTAEHMAKLAIASAHPGTRHDSGTRRRDGISYLIEQKRLGLETPLMSAYEAEILKQTRTGDLENAWEWAQARAAADG